MSDQGLFNEFPEISAKQWKQKIQYDLKGADYNDTLVWESLEGIKVKPFYHAEDLESIPLHHPYRNSEWKIGQSIFVRNRKKANAKARESLARGAESPIFLVPDETIDLSKLLKGIDLQNTPIHFNFLFLAIRPIENLLKQLKNKKVELHLHFDIIGHLCRNGNWFHSMQKDHEILNALVAKSSTLEGTNALGADLSLYQDAGANMVQQLAYGLAHANEYLNHFSDIISNKGGKSLPITFKVAVGGNYFFEIAKLRALRWLWATIAAEHGFNGNCHVMAVPSRRNKTLYDYNVNMLRTTSECMSAAIGAADTISTMPYDAIYHKYNEFSDRIARNQLILLKEESYFNRASEAVAGCYYIETLTFQLAEKALALFKQVEASGGFLEAFKKGSIRQKIRQSAIKEQHLFDEGHHVLVGTNAYQNPGDVMKADLELYPFVKIKPRKTIMEPIIEKRLAEELEQKRLDNE